MGALKAIHYVKGTVFISQHLLQSSIVVDSRKFGEYCVYLKKALPFEELTAVWFV